MALAARDAGVKGCMSRRRTPLRPRWRRPHRLRRTGCRGAGAPLAGRGAPLPAPAWVPEAEEAAGRICGM
ncbi:MAG: hypothetical protein ACLTYN_10075 [Dysosmobacter welbionis]